MACQLKKNSPIFQISSKVKQNDLFILVRQSNNMSLLKIDGMVNDFKKLWRKKVEDSKVLTSIDMREDCALIMAADSKCNLHVYDTETRDKVFNCGTRISTKDSWNQVMFVNDYAYIANRNFFYIFDIKVSIKGAFS